MPAENFLVSADLQRFHFFMFSYLGAPNTPDFLNQVYFFGKKKISAYIKRKNVV